VQGREQIAAQNMLDDARILEAAGADLLLLECVPSELAARITAQANIPVIGIGAGAACDGQILVLYDILGISAGRIPKLSKNYLVACGGDIAAAVKCYVDEVKRSVFPDAAHSFE